MGISTLVQHIQKDNVASLTVKGSLIEADLKDTEKKHEVRKEQTQSLTDLLGPFNIAPEKLTTIDIKVESERGAGYWFGVLLPFLAPAENVIGASVLLLVKLFPNMRII